MKRILWSCALIAVFTGCLFKDEVDKNWRNYRRENINVDSVLVAGGSPEITIDQLVVGDCVEGPNGPLTVRRVSFAGPGAGLSRIHVDFEDGEGWISVPRSRKVKLCMKHDR